MELWSKDNVKISLDRSVPSLDWCANGYVTSERFRESEEQYRDLYLEYKAEYPELVLFVDARDIGPVSASDTAWVAENILPPLANAGLTREAFIVPASALGRIAVRNYTSRAGKTMEIRQFSDAGDAKDWLRQARR